MPAAFCAGRDVPPLGTCSLESSWRLFAANSTCMDPSNAKSCAGRTGAGKIPYIIDNAQYRRIVPQCGKITLLPENAKTENADDDQVDRHDVIEQAGHQENQDA